MYKFFQRKLNVSKNSSTVGLTTENFKGYETLNKLIHVISSQPWVDEDCNAFQHSSGYYSKGNKGRKILASELTLLMI